MASTKGTVFLAIVKNLRKNPQAHTLVPERLAHYLRDRILVSKWYPAEDYRDLLMVLGKLTGGGSTAWEFLGAGLAQLELTGVYKTLLRENDPAGSLRALPQIWRIQQDSGRIEVTSQPNGAIRFELVDFPFVSAELCGSFTGYAAELLRLSGDDAYHLRKLECRARDELRCLWEWKPSTVDARGTNA